MKEDRKLFIKRIIKDTVLKIIFIYIISLIGKSLFNDLYTEIFKTHTWILIIIVLVISGKLKYKDLVEIDQNFNLYYKAQDFTSPEAKLEACALDRKTYKDIVEKKIHILISLSPQSILIFIAGVYIDNKNVLNKNIEIFSRDFAIGDALQYLALSLLIFYIYYFITCFRDYKRYYLSYTYFRSQMLLQNQKTENCTSKNSVL